MSKSKILSTFFSLVISFSVFIFALGSAGSSAQAASDLPEDPEAPADSKVVIALEYVRQNQGVLGLAAGDLSDIVVTDEYTSDHTGVTHVYLRQRYNGINVYNAIMNINISREDQVLSVGNRFVPNLAAAVAGNPVRLSAEDAVLQAAERTGIEINQPLETIISLNDPAQTVVFSGEGIALEDISASLIYQPLQNGVVRLSWDVSIYDLSAQDWWSMRVDATTGRVLDQNNLVVHDAWGTQGGNTSAKTGAASVTSSSYSSSQTAALAVLPPNSYFVFPPPIESPTHTNPPSPPLTEDNRTLVTDPASASSPFGWHDTNGAAGAEFTISRGNNVHAYQDSAAGNTSVGDEPDGGATLVFSYTLDLTQAPSTFRPAAVTNLFYWNNIIHDVFYEYGFTEASGNFQENNYGNGGVGSDYVYAEAQDGGGSCNANFATPVDGGNPRMQMYTCNLATPNRDGDLDNAVIVHEYAHGISNRLTGGPSTTSCLNNAEQMGEGWSDYLALWATIEPGDAGTDARGIGSYLFGQAANGAGIRPAPYSTNMAVNAYTYDGIKTVSVPHGVGFVWSTMLWEMTWDLIGAHGFDPDLYNGTGGNNLAMQLVMDGMKLQTCSPGFVDGRDAILQADQNLTGGQNQCLIWDAFARRGLGASASQGASTSRSDGTEAYDIPTACQNVLKLSKAADPSPAYAGEVMTYTLVADNDSPDNLTGVVLTDTVPAGTTYVFGSASDGGSESGGVVSFPSATMNTGDTITRTFQVLVDDNLASVQHFYDDFESGYGSWSMTGLWNPESELDTCGATKAPFPSSSNAAYYGDSTTCNYDTGAANSGELIMVSAVDLTGAAKASLHFSSYEETEISASYDRRYVDISTNGGGAWTNLTELNTKGSWYGVEVNLDAYVGNNILIRFRFDSIDGDFNNYFGWMIDNVEIIEVSNVPNAACVQASNGAKACDSISTLVVPAPYGVELDPDAAAGSEDPGETLVYTLQLTNTGATTDTFDLSLSGNAWSTSAPTAVGPLAAGVGTNVNVQVTVDPAANNGDSDVVTVKAVSQADGFFSDNSTLATTANTVYGVSIEPPSAAQSGDPGETVTHTLRVTNTGNTPDTFDLTTSNGNFNRTNAAANIGSPSVVGVPSTVGPLAAGAGQDVVVTVPIALDAAASETQVTVVEVTSQTDSAAKDSSALTTTAQAVFGIVIDPPSAAQSGNPGQTLAYSLYMTNTGNITDSFNLTLSGNAWSTSTPSVVGPLVAGAGLDVMVDVSIDPAANNGDLDSVIVVATSQGDGGVSANSQVTTSVGPNAAPKFTSLPVETAMVGKAYSYTIVSADADSGDKLTITASTLPGWLTLTDHGDRTATLSGTPAAGDLGSHMVVLLVKDEDGAAATQTFILAVNESGFLLFLPVAFEN